MSNGSLSNEELGNVSQQHGRDIVSLREYFDALRREDKARVNERFEIQEKAIQVALATQEKAVAAAITSADRAVTKAEIATDKRFESVNEFRQTLADQTAGFLSRSEYMATQKNFSDKLEILEKIVLQNEGRIQGSRVTKANLYAATGFVATVITIVVLFANKVFN